MAEQLTKDNVKKRINGNRAIVIDFYGDWCVPCKRFAPVFDAVSKDFPNLDFARYDVSEDDKVLAAKLEIRSVPCVIIFNNGKEIDRIIGELSEDEFRERIKEAASKLK